MASFVACCVLFVMVGTVHAQTIVVHNVKVVSPDRSQPLSGADVVIDSGRIVSVAPHSARSHSQQSRLLDGTGMFLTPGLIDSHVHLGQIPGMDAEQEAKHPTVAVEARAQFPRSYLYYGFTTLVDLNSTPALMARWRSQAVYPDTYFCGAAPIIDGYPMAFVPKPARYRMPYFIVDPSEHAELPAGVDPATHTPAAVVARIKRDGGICVKTHFEPGFSGRRKQPVPRLEIIRELVKEAHAQGLPVFLHANSLEAQAFGVEAGVDAMAHGIWKWAGGGTSVELNSSVTTVLDRVVQAQIRWQPTIQVLYGERDVFGDEFLEDRRLVKAIPESLLAWYRTEEGKSFRNFLAESEGIPITTGPQSINALPIVRVRLATEYLAQHGARFVFGSDTPSDQTYANPHGLNGRIEMQRLIDAGLTPKQLFRAATIDNAELLGLQKEIGTVEKGKRANLLLLRGDPTESVEAYDRIEKVILNGKVLDRTTLEAD